MGGLPWRLASLVVYGYERISHLNYPYSSRMTQVWARDRVKKRYPHARVKVNFKEVKCYNYLL
jgi:disulfide oxidoreductase YuzD